MSSPSAMIWRRFGQSGSCSIAAGLDETNSKCTFHSCSPSALAFPEIDFGNENVSTYLYLGNIYYNIPMMKISFEN